MWILRRENEMGAVEPSCTPSSAFLSSLIVPISRHHQRLTAIILAIVGNHKHDLPFEDVVPNETAAYAGDVLIALHQLELATQEPGGR